MVPLFCVCGSMDFEELPGLGHSKIAFCAEDGTGDCSERVLELQLSALLLVVEVWKMSCATSGFRILDAAISLQFLGLKQRISLTIRGCSR